MNNTKFLTLFYKEIYAIRGKISNFAPQIANVETLWTINSNI